MNYIKAQRRKYKKKRDKFITEHVFKTASELAFTAEELADAIELKRIIYVEFGGKKRFPTFQFAAQGQVYEVLQEHLPRLLDSDWNAFEVCFWLYREDAVVIKELKPDARQLEGVTLDEVLRIAEKAGELTEICTARPIDLAVAGNNEAFSAFVEHWLAPDHRRIPEPTVPPGFWESFFA